MPDVTVKQVIEKRVELESMLHSLIAQAVYDFIENTHVHVNQINFDLTHEFDDHGKLVTKVGPVHVRLMPL